MPLAAVSKRSWTKQAVMTRTGSAHRMAASLFITWYGDSLADIPENLNGKSAAYYIANAYQKLEDIVQEKFACIIAINEQITQQKLDQYLDYFPAVWLWTLPYTNRYIGNMVAKECKKRKRVFTGPPSLIFILPNC
jgi:fructose-1,6-bisphosphatase